MLNFRNKLRHAYPANPQGKSTAVIPQGMFCLDCPYSRRVAGKPKDTDGYCAMLNVGDWQRGEFPMLFDGIKICGFHPEEEDDLPGRPRRFAERPKFTATYGGWRTIYRRGDPRRHAGWNGSKPIVSVPREESFKRRRFAREWFG